MTLPLETLGVEAPDSAVDLWGAGCIAAEWELVAGSGSGAGAGSGAGSGSGSGSVSFRADGPGSGSGSVSFRGDGPGVRLWLVPGVVWPGS